MQPAKIEISARTIIFIVFFLLFLKFLWMIQDLLFSLFIAFIIVSALKPAVSFLEVKKFPRLLAVILVYFLFLGFIIILLSNIFPPLIKESTNLARSLPDIFESAAPQLSKMTNIESLAQFIPNITNRFFDLVKNIFSNTLFVISTLFFGFYLLLEENMIQKTLLKFLPEKQVGFIGRLIEKAEKRMSSWFWGEFALMFTVGTMNFIGLSLIGIKYALPLAVLAGLLEAVPNLGPTIAAVPAFLIGFSQSMFLGIAAIALATVIQQLENNLIVPMIMRKAVGLHPITTLISLIIGGKVAGVLGVLLAVPTTLLIETILLEVVKEPRK